MKPQQYIDILGNAIRDFDFLAEESIREVGIDFFKKKFRDAFDKSKTIKGNSFEGIDWYANGKEYRKDFTWRGTYKFLNLSNLDGNDKSFRKSMYFDGNGKDLTIKDNASYKGSEYGSKVIENLMNNGIDVLEYENKTDQEKGEFIKNFVRLIFEEPF